MLQSPTDDGLNRLKTACRYCSWVALALEIVVLASVALVTFTIIVLMAVPSAVDSFYAEGFDVDFSSGQAALLMLMVDLLLLTALIILMLLRNIMRDISREYTPFTQNNIQRLRRMSVVLVVLPVASALSYMAINPSGTWLTDGLSLILSGLIASAFVYSLSLIFRYGASLQKQSDETL